MNVDLPIAFDGWCRMEIDLLCADSRLVVEVDGAQHLADPAAYRRDRRKDQLLQENGYLVLRYLAEDLAKELDSVLDGILRSLSSRQTPTSMVMVPIAAVRHPSVTFRRRLDLGAKGRLLCTAYCRTLGSGSFNAHDNQRH
jgi:hypothetical protein